jgi:hypothetical protein
MREAGRFQHGTGIAALAIKLVVAAIVIALKDPGPCREMGLRVLAAPIARLVEQGSWRIGPGKGAVIAHIDP